MKKQGHSYSHKITGLGVLLAAASWMLPALGRGGDASPLPRGVDYDLSWHTIDGGGEIWSTGGDFELGGTIGQPDAGAMTGGDFELSGGFWFTAVAAPPACACGDLTGDGEVNLADFVTFARCFGLTASTPGCSAEELACSDLDGSGEVTLADFVTFAQLFGQPASGSPPDCSP